MAFKLIIPLILTLAASSTNARIVSPDRPGTIASADTHNSISQPYSYAYNMNGPLPATNRYHTPMPISQTPVGVASMIDHQQLLLAPSVYPNQIHTLTSGQQLNANFQPHEPIVAVPTAPAIIRHPNGRPQLHSSKMSVPTASAIIRPQVPLLSSSHMQSNVIPYQQVHSTPSHAQAPVFVVQPFTWYGKSQHSSTSSPINASNNKPPAMPAIVRVPTATIRPPAPAYGKIPSNHPNAIHEEEPVPYLNAGIRPVILGRYGYALTNAPFKLKYAQN